MIESVSRRNFKGIYDQSSFQYAAYAKWLNEGDSLHKFLTVASSTAPIRARNEWNTLGREVYDVVEIGRHARAVSEILTEVDLTDFFVRQTVRDDLWFRGTQKAREGWAKRMIAFLEVRGAALDFSVWRGGFIVRSETREFLEVFTDYPLFGYGGYPLEMLSLQSPLLMSLNHHLCIDYTSEDTALIENLKGRIVSRGILEFSDRE